MKALLLTSLLLASPVAIAAEMHVSAAHGDDANPGTTDKPVSSLVRARDLARVIKADADDSHDDWVCPDQVSTFPRRLCASCRTDKFGSHFVVPG